MTNPHRCHCPEWRDNIEHVHAPFRMLAALNPRSYTGYTGLPFHYCPWCGGRLPALVCLEGAREWPL